LVHRSARTPDRRLLVAAFSAITLAFVLSQHARADQATFGVGAPEQWDVPAGTSISYAYNLYICGAGAPNIVYESGETFAPGENVTATLTPVVWPTGFGTIELTGATSVVGSIPATWPSDCATFEPEVSFRYTAPTAAELDCDDHPGESLPFVYPGAHVEFVGDAGTRAHTDASLASGLSYEAAIPVGVRCPAASPTPTPAPSDPLAGGSASFTLESVLEQGEPFRPLAGTDFEIAVTNGGPSTTVVTTGADGTVSFDVTVTAGYPAALIEITELARTDYPLNGASCWYDGHPLLDWSPRPNFTVEVQSGWDAGCTFYHKVAGASPNPTPGLTPPPTDMDTLAAANGMPVIPVMVVLLAITAVGLLRHARQTALTTPPDDSASWPRQ
jgi:hypothetical protein